MADSIGKSLKYINSSFSRYPLPATANSISLVAMRTRKILARLVMRMARSRQETL